MKTFKIHILEWFVIETTSKHPIELESSVNTSKVLTCSFCEEKFELPHKLSLQAMEREDEAS